MLLMVLGISIAGNLLFPLSLVLAFASMSFEQRIAVLASTLAALLSVGGGFVLLYVGRRRLGTWFFLVAQWLIIVLSSIPFGLGGGWTAAVPMMIVLAGFLLTWRGTLALAALFVLGMFGIGVLQVYNIPPTPPATGDEIILHLGLVVGSTLVTGSVVSVLSGQIAGLVEESLRWIRRMHAVFSVGRSMSTITDFREMLLAVVEQVQEGFDFYHAQIFLIQEDGSDLALQASTAPDVEQLLRTLDRPTVGEESVIGRAALGRAVVVNDIADNELFRPQKHLPDTKAQAALPMMTGGRVIGVLDVTSVSPNAFANESVRALQALANQIAVAIQTTSEAAPEAAVLEALDPVFRASREIMTASDAGGIIDTLRERVLGGFDHISLVQFRDALDGVMLEEVGGWDCDGASPGSETPVALCRAADEEALIISDVFDLSEAWADYQPFLRDRLALGSVGIFPLRGRARPIGYLLVGKRQPHVFSEREHRTLLSLSGQIALLLENRLLQQEFQERAGRLNRLNAFIEAASAISSMESLYDVMAAHVAGIMNYCYLSLALLEPDQETLRVIQMRSPDGRPGIVETLSPQDTASGRALEGRQIVVAGDVMDLADGDMWLMAGVRALAVAPVLAGEKPLGTINLGRDEVDSFTPEEVSILEQVASQVGIAIKNIRTMEQIQLTMEDLATLLFASQHMLEAGSSEDILQALTQILSGKASVDRVIVLRGGPEDTYPPSFFEVATVWNRTEEYAQLGPEEGKRYTRENFPFIIHEEDPNETVFYENIEREPRLDEAARNSLREMGIRAIIRLPMTRGQRWYGEALLISCGGASLVQADTQLYQTIVDQAAFALESAGLVDRLSTSVVESRALYTTSYAVGVAQSVEDIVNVALSQLVTLNDAARGYLYLTDPDPALRSERVRLAAWWEGGGIHWPEADTYVVPESVPVLAEVTPTNEYDIFNDAANDETLGEAVRESFRARGVSSVAVIHLRAGVDWMGAVVLEGGEDHAFSDDTVELCRGIANLCGLALNLQLALRRSRGMATQEQILRLISDRIRSAPDVESVLRIAVNELGRVLNLEEGAARLKGGEHR
jgi:GAF domain-containing protein